MCARGLIFNLHTFNNYPPVPIIGIVIVRQFALPCCLRIFRGGGIVGQIIYFGDNDNKTNASIISGQSDDNGPGRPSLRCVRPPLEASFLISK